MDSLELVVVASPFSNLAPLYEVDPDADVLLIVPPPQNHPFLAPWNDQSLDANGVRPWTTSTAAAAAPPSQTGLRIKVSSKHLALASRVFRTKLQSGRARAAARQSDGRVHVQLAEGFDARAVSMVMNAVHGRGSRVPRSVDLETLARIALVVDRFQLLDAVDVYAERWISGLETTALLPDAPGRDLSLWIYIGHVFRRAETFRAATKLAAVQSPGPIRTFGLPIRDKIIRDIDTQRQALLAEALGQLHQALDALASDSAACSAQHCDALLLGDLVKSLHRQRLAWPRPERPFPGVSFASLVEAVHTAASRNMAPDPSPATGIGWWSSDGTGGISQDAEKRVAAAAAWARVGGTLPVTPDASPEPVFRSGVFDNVHECAATKVAGRLDGLGRLGNGVAGLELESSMGYQRY